MRTGLRLSALAVLFIAVVLWLFGGAHRGFSKTHVLVMKADPVTGQEMADWEPRPVLGVDFLAASATLAALLLGTSWLFRNRSSRNPNQPQPS